jgi:hypothetical protein
MVSDQGRIFSFYVWRFLGGIVDPGGHIKIRPYGESYRYIHDLVLTAFVCPRPPGLITRHLNGIPSDNRLTNLAWGTQSENQYDVKYLGGSAKRLSIDEVVGIKRALAAGVPYKELAIQFNTSRANISNISNRHRHADVQI